MGGAQQRPLLMYNYVSHQSQIQFQDEDHAVFISFCWVTSTWHRWKPQPVTLRLLPVNYKRINMYGAKQRSVFYVYVAYQSQTHSQDTDNCKVCLYRSLVDNIHLTVVHTTTCDTITIRVIFIAFHAYFVTPHTHTHLRRRQSVGWSDAHQSDTIHTCGANYFHFSYVTKNKT